MLTVNAVSNAGKAAHYFSKSDDYYSKEGSGTWMGKGAAALNLTGDVDFKVFRSLLDGDLPTGEKIKQTFSKADEKRHGWDFTFSAPKSVSMQALIGGDQRIIEAHNKAVQAAIEMMEKYAVARKKVKGKSHREHTNNLVAATFQHELSRAKDPQLHTHVVIMNMTQRSDKQWRALANEELFKHEMLLGAAYRAEFARAVQVLGYELRITDKTGSFELAHISREQIEAFSQRSMVIEQALAIQGKTRADSSAREKEIIALATRPAKDRLTDDDRHLLMEHWKEKSIQHGIVFDRSHAPKCTVNESGSVGQESLDYAIAHLTERQSVVMDSMLFTTAMQHGVGRTTHAELKRELNKKIAVGEIIVEQAKYYMAAQSKNPQGRSSAEWVSELVAKKMSLGDAVRYVENAIEKGTLVKSEDRYTTAIAWRTEQAILRAEREGRERMRPIMQTTELQKKLDKTNLNKGQRAAVENIMTTRNRVIGIQGSAGTGKSYLIKSAQEFVHDAGLKLVVVAPYANQVERLEADGLRACTLATFLVAKEKNINEKTIIVIDEAGLVPTRQMQAVLEVAERYGSRVVLSGDIQQLKAVEAGRPFAQLQAHGMQTAIVDEIKRQKSVDLKPAVELASKGHVIESLSHIGQRIYEISESKTRRDAIALSYASLPDTERQKTLIVSGTNEARRELNDLVRTEIGIKGQGREYDILSRRDLTQAERRYAPSYRINDYLQPEKDYVRTQLQRGELYRVAEIETGNRLVIEAKDGRRIEINPRQHTELSIYERGRNEFAAGDWVRITRNDAALDVSNGDRMRVLKAESNQVELQNEKGRKISIDTSKPLHIEHAYATTVHSAQGLSVDRVMVEVDTRSMTTGKDLYYVAISRARHEVSVYTDSRADLPTAINRENIKTAALDIEQQPFHRSSEHGQINKTTELQK